ncbi:MAG: galactose mutarotase [Clostridia bacterium]|nr:galactose mutarotase [Clostridia bacterium]
MNKNSFGRLPSGVEVFEYHINYGDFSASVIDFGATLRTLSVFGVDVCGGFDEIGGYLCDNSHQGGTIGRVANRIAGASFTLDGVEYRLPRNNGESCLHGGEGFDRRTWEVVSHTESAIRLKYISRDGEEGFPAELTVFVEYRLTDLGLYITYSAVANGKTPVSLTNHTYFNLDGLGKPITSHGVAVFADFYTEVDERLIPTGNRPSVLGTPFDLNKISPIGGAIKALGGVDHNFILSGKCDFCPYGTPMRHAAAVENGKIRMDVYTDREGVQLYTGNFLGDGPNFKGGVRQVKHGALCLETQTEPNGVNNGRDILAAGEEYTHATLYAFSKM